MSAELNSEMKGKYDSLQKEIDALKSMDGALMPIMQKAQEIFGYLPEDVQTLIARELDIPVGEVYGVATFYAQFRLKPSGRFQIGLCMGTACYVKGAQKVFEKLQSELDVPSGGTTPDGKFTLEATRCLGACGLAPVMMINEDVYGRLSSDEIPSIIAKYEGK